MICTQCHQEISFNQWLNEMCGKDRTRYSATYHSLFEADIRFAYLSMLTQAAYARTQP